MAADASVSIGADLGELRRELAKIPNLSGEAAQEMLVKVERAVTRAEKVAKRAIKSTSKAQQQAAREAEQAARSAQEGFKGLIELSGVSGDKLEKVRAVAGALASPIGAATVAITGAGLAVAGLAAGITASVLAADDLAASLDPFYEIEAFPGITPEAAASIDRANAAVSGLGSIAESMVVTLGAHFAPLVEKVAVLLVKLGLAAADSLAEFTEGRSILRKFADLIVGHFVKSLTLPIRLFAMWADAAAMAAEAVGQDGIAGELRAASGAYDDFVSSVSTTAVDYYFDAAGDAVDGLSGSLSDYDERAQAVISTAAKLADEEKNGAERARARAEAARAEAEALREQERAAKELASAIAKVEGIADRAAVAQMDAIARIEHARDQELAQLDALVAKHQESAILANEAEMARVEVIARAEQEIAEVRAKAAADAAKLAEDAAATETAAQISAYQTRLDYADKAIGAIGDLSDALIDRQMAGLEEGTAAHRKAAKRQFAIQKALAIAGALVDAGKAALVSIATLGPPVPPNFAGIAGMVATGAIAAGSIGAIAASSPPQFFVGGMIGKGQAPDAQTITAHRGEAVLTRAAVERIGEQGVRDLNEGRAGAGPQTIVVQQVYKHRTLDVQIQDAARDPGSSLRTATKQGDRVGHRTRSTP